MSTEIATWNMIHTKIPSFPAPTSGRGNECLTKAEIQSLGGENLSIEGSYGNNECAMLENIAKVTWEYTFSVAPASLEFPGTGGSQIITVTSYKRKYINDQDTGIQENVDWNYSGGSDWITINQLSFNELSIIIQENNTESPRNSNITFIQNESGKSINKSIDQAAGVVRWVYTFNVAPASLSFAAIGGTQSVQVASYKDKYIGKYYTGIRLNVGFSSSTSASWLSSTGTSVTASENTVTSPRSGIVNYTQNESGNTGQVTVGQSEAVVKYGYNVHLAYGDLVEADRIDLIWRQYETFPKHVRIEAFRDTYMNNRIINTINIDWTYDKNEGHFGHYSVSRNASGLEFTPIDQNDTGEVLIETFSITAVGVSYPQAAITCHHKHY